MASLPLCASPIAADGTFHEFQFGTVGTFAYACSGACGATSTPVADVTATLPFTFSGPGKVFVLDLFLPGDEFTLYDNSVRVGSTSTYIFGGGPNCYQDIACATGNAQYSQGTFALGAGDHSLTIQVLQNAPRASSGDAVLSVSAVTPTVPEPDSMLLVGTGVLAVLVFPRVLRPRTTCMRLEGSE